jgi:hypothetical protein
MAISEVALEPVVPFFHFITKPKIFIAGPTKAGLDDGTGRGARSINRITFPRQSPDDPGVACINGFLKPRARMADANK